LHINLLSSTSKEARNPLKYRLQGGMYITYTIWQWELVCL